MSTNSFGGKWTKEKIELVLEYVQAYLIIMNKYPKYKLLYFDGFAGSGKIILEEEGYEHEIEGAASRILEINHPKEFDLYYFVEKKKSVAESLKSTLGQKYPDKQSRIKVVSEDCNSKLLAMADFMRNEGRNYRTLAFVDPYGMQVSWESIQALKNLGVDLWILVPTGVGANRLLTRNGENISVTWAETLQRFLGIEKEEIYNQLYCRNTQQTLFGEEVTTLTKEDNAIRKLAGIYRKRLGEVFTYVSEPHVLRTKKNVTLYHFFMASNVEAAYNIANHVIKKRLAN